MLAVALLALAAPNLGQILDDPKLVGAHVSAYVCDLTGKVIFEKNSNSHVIPASNQKLFTGAFALFNLGPTYRPRTDIWKLFDRTVVDSPGDPLLTHELLSKAAQKLELNKKLDVYVKEAYAPGIPDSWEIDDLPNKYAAPITAFTVDHGAFELWNQNGKPKLIPESYGVKIVRELPFEPKFSSKYDPFEGKIQTVGYLPAEFKQLDTLALAHPDAAAASVLGKLFVPSPDKPTTAPDLSIFGGDMVAMLKACLPPSDNNVAENLFLMGAIKQGDLGLHPYEVARPRLTRFLIDTVGISEHDIRVFDGSGMSRHNLTTTRALAKLLTWSQAQTTSDLWVSCLAVPGKGTLANRLKGLDFHGKTGTLDMVVALSGYVKTKSGQTLVVSVVLNDFLCPSEEARGIADEFVRNIAELGD